MTSGFDKCLNDAFRSVGFEEHPDGTWRHIQDDSHERVTFFDDDLYEISFQIQYYPSPEKWFGRFLDYAQLFKWLLGVDV